MKYLLIAIIIVFITTSQIQAAATKIYDKEGFRLGTCHKNGTTFEAYDTNGEPILKDAMNNDMPSTEAYFYDRNGNIIKFSNEKRTLTPVYIRFNDPEPRLIKAPIYGIYRSRF